MESSIFRYTWRRSKARQFQLLAVTLLSLPFVYITLELPKQIVNDAISGDGPYEIIGVTITQTQFLLALCIGFLLAVTGQGLVKMRINVMAGVLAERMLERFR